MRFDDDMKPQLQKQKLNRNSAFRCTCSFPVMGEGIVWLLPDMDRIFLTCLLSESRPISLAVAPVETTTALAL